MNRDARNGSEYGADGGRGRCLPKLVGKRDQARRDHWHLGLRRCLVLDVFGVEMRKRAKS